MLVAFYLTPSGAVESVSHTKSAIASRQMHFIGGDRFRGNANP
ncbi:MAG: hypothetical protein AAF411_06875 [Myxococcota bacterium]